MKPSSSKSSTSWRKVTRRLQAGSPVDGGLSSNVGDSIARDQNAIEKDTENTG